MKIRVINYSEFENFCEDLGIDISLHELTDEQFMNIYNDAGGDWEFNSLKEFADEFNADGPYAPTPSSHIIRFFPNE